MNTLGPLQLVVIGTYSATVLPAVARHFEHRDDEQQLRLIDALTVAKDGEGAIAIVEVPDEFLALVAMPGEMATSLFGSDDPRMPLSMIRSNLEDFQRDSGDFGLSQDQILEVADLIPRSSMALFLLIEHCWALNVRASVVQKRSILANGLMTPATLVEMRRLNIKPLD